MPTDSSQNSPDMNAFRKAREAQRRAEEERIRAEREIRQKATARLVSAKAREKEAYEQLLQRLSALKLRIRPDKPLGVYASVDRSDRKSASDEVPSSVSYGHTLKAPGAHCVFNVEILLRFDPGIGTLRISLSSESAVGGHKVAPKGVWQEWNDVDSLMQALIQWALNVPEIEAC